LIRGYGRQSRDIIILSNQNTLRHSVHETGDEPALLARQLPGIRVVVGRDRVKGARKAIDECQCNVLILDDGFQHRRIQRDLDVVLIDASNPWGNGYTLPAGPLREPVSCVKRAHAIVVSRTNEIPDWKSIYHKRRWIGSIGVFPSIHRSLEWIQLPDGNSHPLDYLKGKRVLACVGIGNPDSFQHSLSCLGLTVVKVMIFPDHHWFRDTDLKRIASEGEKAKIDALVMTEKDAVRFEIPPDWPFPTYALKVVLEMLGGSQPFSTLLDSLLFNMEERKNQWKKNVSW
jgi:tetraacyldisaccharide 4'-kinase